MSVSNRSRSNVFLHRSECCLKLLFPDPAEIRKGNKGLRFGKSQTIDIAPLKSLHALYSKVAQNTPNFLLSLLYFNMANGQKDWVAFRDWETNICLEKNPKHSVVQLQTELLQEWQDIPKKGEFGDALRSIKVSLEDVRSTRSQAKRRKTALTNLVSCTSNEKRIEKLESFKRGLKRLLDALRVCVEDLQTLRDLQLDTNAAGHLNSSNRSREYVADMLKEYRDDIRKVNMEHGQCRQDLGGLGINTGPVCGPGT